MAALSPFRFLLIVILISSVALFTVSQASEDPETADQKPFAYGDKEAKGPKKWGTIKPEWEVCNNGKMQSPIDMINERVKVLPSLGALEIKYKASLAAVTNRGHDIAVEWEGDAGGVKINGINYKLVNIHWHSPSEHTVNGTSYAMEGHMVHKSADSGIAVIGILYKIGRPDPFIAKFLPAIKAATENGTSVGKVHPKGIKFNKRSEYYRYIGSLTTPPCTEGVIWTLVKKVRTVSHSQLHALREAVHDGYETNARPVQNINGRIINLSTPNQ